MASADTAVEPSVTAQEYISRQLKLEREARELMPYSFETCTYSMGPLRQPVFACKTHSPPGHPAAICYSCSISCHSNCDLVELFNKRNIVCDCGTTRFQSTIAGPAPPCTLRAGGGRSDPPAETNRYCHNYEGRFCSCDRDYDASKETGTMYQCLLGDVCNEDWFHDVCIVGYKEEEGGGMENGQVNGGKNNDVKMEEKDKTTTTNGTDSSSALSNDPSTTQLPSTSNPTTSEPTNTDAAVAEDDADSDDDDGPPGFPPHDSFDSFFCFLCVAKNPWLRNYSGSPGFLPAVVKKDAIPPTPPGGDETSPSSALTTTVPITANANDTSIPTGDANLNPATTTPNPLKRKASPASIDTPMPDATTTTPPTSFSLPPAKRPNRSPSPNTTGTHCIVPSPPPSLPPPTHPISLFLTHPPHLLPTPLCPCPSHLSPLNPLLRSPSLILAQRKRPPPPLLTFLPLLTSAEETYEPPLSPTAQPSSPTSSRAPSILDMGERALSTIDRVRAIEGVMAYNHIREKVKDFLKPFAEEGREVGAEDVRKWFEGLRGDMDGGGGGGGNGGRASGSGSGSGEGEGDGRREQKGY